MFENRKIGNLKPKVPHFGLNIKKTVTIRKVLKHQFEVIRNITFFVLFNVGIKHKRSLVKNLNTVHHHALYSCSSCLWFVGTLHTD